MQSPITVTGPFIITAYSLIFQPTHGCDEGTNLDGLTNIWRSKVLLKDKRKAGSQTSSSVIIMSRDVIRQWDLGIG